MVKLLIYIKTKNILKISKEMLKNSKLKNLISCVRTQDEFWRIEFSNLLLSLNLLSSSSFLINFPSILVSIYSQAERNSVSNVKKMLWLFTGKSLRGGEILILSMLSGLGWKLWLWGFWSHIRAHRNLLRNIRWL